jgi:hypothetical protein
MIEPRLARDRCWEALGVEFTTNQHAQTSFATLFYFSSRDVSGGIFLFTRIGMSNPYAEMNISGVCRIKFHKV